MATLTSGPPCTTVVPVLLRRSKKGSKEGPRRTIRSTTWSNATASQSNGRRTMKGVTMQGTCDVCGAKDVQVHVASSPVAPISWAHCEGCIKKWATPLVDFAYLYDFVSKDGQGLRPEVNELTSYKDGKYITWQEYVD